MLEKYRENFASLTPTERQYLHQHLHNRHPEWPWPEPDPTQPNYPEGDMFENLKKMGLDQSDVVMAFAQDSSPLSVVVLEKLVGRPIVRPVAIEQRPKPAAPVRTASSSSSRAAGSSPVTRADDRTVHLLVSSNPKKPGSASYARFAVYQEGMTVQEALKGGVTAADLKWDLDRKFIELRAPVKVENQSEGN